MVRTIACLTALLLLGTTSRGSELDDEFGSSPPSNVKQTVADKPAPSSLAPPVLIALRDPTTSASASELDAESPVQAWHHFGGFGGWGGWGHFGGFGFGRGFGWGGLGWGGLGWGGLGWGGLGWGGLGWGGYGGYGLGWGGLGWGGYGGYGLGWGGGYGMGYGYGMGGLGLFGYGFPRWGCW